MFKKSSNNSKFSVAIFYGTDQTERSGELSFLIFNLVTCSERNLIFPPHCCRGELEQWDMAYSSMRRRSSFEHPPYATTPDEFYRCCNHTMQYPPFENSEKQHYLLFIAITIYKDNISAIPSASCTWTSINKTALHMKIFYIRYSFFNVHNVRLR